MSGLLDADGNPVLDREACLCPDCGSGEKDHETVFGFGGHVLVICKKCGQRLNAEATA
jgi:uncharacterized Zn finger protein